MFRTIFLSVSQPKRGDVSVQRRFELKCGFDTKYEDVSKRFRTES